MLFYRVQIYGPGDLNPKPTPKVVASIKKCKTFNDFLNSSTASFSTQIQFVYPQSKSPSLDYLCYPEGFRIYRPKPEEIASRSPQSFPFVVTSEEGSRCYITCLKFYEKLPEESAKALKDGYNKIVSNDGSDPTKIDNSQLEDLYYQKCICIFSRMPYFTFAR